MQRPILDFMQDEHADWVARLGCGHRQHVRHKPPFWSRPWVMTPEGRAGMVGQPLDCPLCDRFELPTDAVPYKRTPDFTTDTVPAGLRRDHTTRSGVWGRIHVLEGQLRYVVEPPLARDLTLSPGDLGVVVPEVPHRVEPVGVVRFYVELLRVPVGDART